MRRPPSVTRSGLGRFSEELIEKRFPVEQSKILTHLGEVHLAAITLQQRSYILDVLSAARVIYNALQLERDQAFLADHMHLAQARRQPDSSLQKPLCNGAVRV